MAATNMHLTNSFIHGSVIRRFSSSPWNASSRTSRRNMATASMMVKSRRQVVIPMLAALVAAAASPVALVAAAQDQEEYTRATSGLEFCDTLLGTGDSISKGALIKVHYTGKLEDGTVFDSSYNRGKPLSFNVGVGQVIKGWDEGILGGNDVPPMLAGGKRKLRIPPSLGYGERGAGCRGKSCIIPPNSVLLFDVELVGKAYN